MRYGDLTADERAELPVGTRLLAWDTIPALTRDDWGWVDDHGIRYFVPSPMQRVVRGWEWPKTTSAPERLPSWVREHDAPIWHRCVDEHGYDQVCGMVIAGAPFVMRGSDTPPEAVQCVQCRMRSKVKP